MKNPLNLKFQLSLLKKTKLNTSIIFICLLLASIMITFTAFAPFMIDSFKNDINTQYGDFKSTSDYENDYTTGGHEQAYSKTLGLQMGPNPTDFKSISDVIAASAQASNDIQNKQGNGIFEQISSNKSYSNKYFNGYNVGPSDPNFQNVWSGFDTDQNYLSYGYASQSNKPNSALDCDVSQFDENGYSSYIGTFDLNNDANAWSNTLQKNYISTSNYLHYVLSKKDNDTQYAKSLSNFFIVNSISTPFFEYLPILTSGLDLGLSLKTFDEINITNFISTALAKKLDNSKSLSSDTSAQSFSQQTINNFVNSSNGPQRQQEFFIEALLLTVLSSQLKNVFTKITGVDFANQILGGLSQYAQFLLAISGFGNNFTGSSPGFLESLIYQGISSFISGNKAIHDALYKTGLVFNDSQNTPPTGVSKLPVTMSSYVDDSLESSNGQPLKLNDVFGDGAGFNYKVKELDSGGSKNSTASKTLYCPSFGSISPLITFSRILKLYAPSSLPQKIENTLEVTQNRYNNYISDNYDANSIDVNSSINWTTSNDTIFLGFNGAPYDPEKDSLYTSLKINIPNAKVNTDLLGLTSDTSDRFWKGNEDSFNRLKNTDVFINRNNKKTGTTVLDEDPFAVMSDYATGKKAIPVVINQTLAKKDNFKVGSMIDFTQDRSYFSEIRDDKTGKIPESSNLPYNPTPFSYKARVISVMNNYGSPKLITSRELVNYLKFNNNISYENISNVAPQSFTSINLQTILPNIGNWLKNSIMNYNFQGIELPLETSNLRYQIQSYSLPTSTPIIEPAPGSANIDVTRANLFGSAGFFNEIFFPSGYGLVRNSAGKYAETPINNTGISDQVTNIGHINTRIGPIPINTNVLFTKYDSNIMQHGYDWKHKGAPSEPSSWEADDEGYFNGMLSTNNVPNALNGLSLINNCENNFQIGIGLATSSYEAEVFSAYSTGYIGSINGESISEISFLIESIIWILSAILLLIALVLSVLSTRLILSSNKKMIYGLNILGYQKWKILMKIALPYILFMALFFITSFVYCFFLTKLLIETIIDKFTSANSNYFYHIPLSYTAILIAVAILVLFLIPVAILAYRGIMKFKAIDGIK